MNINEKIKKAKQRLLKMHFEKKVGHIGGNLSALDALMVLHHNIMTKNDRFILSKGHSAGALYVTLHSLGKLTDDDLNTFHADQTKLAGHPIAGWIEDIPIATGSLGHGFSVALGLALGRKLNHTPGHIYCMTSDGEWQEGSTWEALIFFAHHQLTNLTVLIDCNGLQGFGTTKEVASMHRLQDKIAAFNVKVVEVNGHAPDLINEIVRDNPGSIIILTTTKGAGISFMENRMEWHYLPMNAQQFMQALQDVTDDEK